MNWKRRILVLIITAAVLFAAVPVFAATSDKAIEAAGSQATGGAYYGGAADYTNLNSDDGNTTYLQFQGVGTGYRSYNMVDFSTSNAEINSVTLYYKSYQEDSGQSNTTAYARVSSNNYYGDINNGSGSGRTLSYTWTTNPATGTAWTNTTLNAAEFGIRYASGSSGGNWQITYLYITVDYDPVSAPDVTTDAADDITPTSATLNGTIDDDNGATLTNYGFVWGNEERADPGNTAPSASAYDSNYEAGAGSYSEGAIERATGATLSEGTTYYYRAAAYNSEGWAYGDEVEFSTIGDPSGNTTAATNVTSATARLNASVTDDGGQACDIRFGYGESSETAIDDYDFQTSWDTDAWDTGEFPYETVTSLSTSTLYYFRVAIRNDAGTTLGDELQFTTESGVFEPTEVTAIPGDDSISLLWVKDAAAYTLVKYSTGDYPADTDEGEEGYFDTGTSVTIEDLDPSTTYFISLWGYTDGVFSSGDPLQVLTTTLAYGETDTTEYTPPSNDTWNQTPDATKFQNIPWLSTLLQETVADPYEIPFATVAYTFWLFLSAGVPIKVYNSRHNIFQTIVLAAIIVGIGAWLGLMMLWIIFALLIIAAGFTYFAERR